ncbi:MAG: hypothetical protein ACK559_21850, partial [bacterium]
MADVDAGVEDRDHRAFARGGAPGPRRVDVGADEAAGLAGVLEVPLVGGEGVVGHAVQREGQHVVGVGPAQARAGP